MCHLILTLLFTVNKTINKLKNNNIFNIQKHNKTEYKYVQSIEDIYIYIERDSFLIYTYIFVDYCYVHINIVHQ